VSSPAPASPSMLSAALDYAAHRWPVFPVHEPAGVGRCSCSKGADCERLAKHPRVEHGLLEATTDERQIRAWWSRWPSASIGIRTGEAAGCWILDIDKGKPGEAKLAELEATHGPLPVTQEAVTGGGGRHLLFAWPEGRSIQTRNRLRIGDARVDGFDVRAEGGYALLAPSRHASGGVYRWTNDAPIADAPAWLLDIVDPPKPSPSTYTPAPAGAETDRHRAYVSKALAGVCSEIAAMTDGRRQMLFDQARRFGGYVAAGLVAEERVFGELVAAGRASGTRHNVERTVADGIRYGLPYPLRPELEDRPMPQRSAPAAAPEPVPEPPEDLPAFDEPDVEPPPDQPILVATIGGQGVFVRTRGGAYVHAPRDLVWAELGTHAPWVSTHVLKKGEEVRIPIPDLLTAWGRRADRIIYDLVEGRTGYDPTEDRGGTLFLPCAKLVDVQPERSPDVAEWLKAFFGPNLPVGLDWLATVTELRHPTAAIYLDGPAGIGKGMLASAIAALWGAERCAFANVVGSFNGALVRSPVVFLDEGYTGDVDSTSFRSMVAESEHAINEKFKPAATLRGCLRLIIAANGPNALRIRDKLTPESRAAIAERVLYLKCTKAAKMLLDGRGGRKLTGRWIDDNGQPGELVRHLAWLAVDRGPRVVRGPRYLVTGGNDSSWMTSELEAHVLEAVAVAVATSDGCILEVNEESIVVSPEALHRRWKSLMRTVEPPSREDIGIALGGEARRLNRAGERVRTRVIESGRVRAAAARASVGLPSSIEPD
jgi:hypothetical protein